MVSVPKVIKVSWCIMVSWISMNAHQKWNIAQACGMVLIGARSCVGQCWKNKNYHTSLKNDCVWIFFCINMRFSIIWAWCFLVKLTEPWFCFCVNTELVQSLCSVIFGSQHFCLSGLTDLCKRESAVELLEISAYTSLSTWTVGCCYNPVRVLK